DNSVVRAPQDRSGEFGCLASSSLEIQTRAPQTIPKEGIGGGSFYNHTQPILEDSVNKPSVKTLQHTQGLDSKAIYDLGGAYYKGKGVPQDYSNVTNQPQSRLLRPKEVLLLCRVERSLTSKAMEWYLKAANQGNAVALNNLGEMYQYGKGVPQDYSKAMEWYLKAAKQGHASAQYKIENMSQ
ncbi:hypothetical protein BGX26_006274, partial [Mortierella sp. AD094]